MLGVVAAVVGSYVAWRSRQMAPDTAPGAGPPGERHGDDAPPDRARPDGGHPMDPGVDPGVPDPQGRPGLHGPRGESICVHRLPPAPAAFHVRGRVAAGASDPGANGMTVVAAVDRPVHVWGRNRPVALAAVVFVRGDRFDLPVPQAGLYVCALRTLDFQEFTYVHAGGCTAGPVASDQSDVLLALGRLQVTRELIGLAGAVPSSAWPAAERRVVSGRVQATGAQRFLVSLASAPIVEQSDVEGNPAALAVAREDGRFHARFLSRVAEPLYVCAVGLPPAGADIRSLRELPAAGCVAVPLPEGRAAGGTVPVGDVTLTLRPGSTYRMTAHEQAHYDFLSRCLDPADGRGFSPAR